MLERHRCNSPHNQTPMNTIRPRRTERISSSFNRQTRREKKKNTNHGRKEEESSREKSAFPGKNLTPLAARRGSFDIPGHAPRAWTSSRPRAARFIPPWRTETRAWHIHTLGPRPPEAVIRAAASCADRNLQSGRPRFN